MFKKAFKKLIGKYSSFNKYMGKMKRTLNSVLLRRKRIKLGRKGKKAILAAEWVDKELIENIKLRSRLSRSWRFSRKNNLPKEIQEECK